MKRITAALLILVGINTMLTSQTTVSLGVKTGAGSTNVLLSTSTTINRYSRTISLYTASEIVSAGGSAGIISSLAWDKDGTGEYSTNDAYIKIFLKHHNDSAWSTSPVPAWDTEVIGASEVFTSSTYSLPTGTGWMTVPFTTPFVWNGTDNIAVFVEWDRASAPTGAINWGRSTTTNANASRVGSSSLAALIMLINSNRPLVQLTITSGPPIDSLEVNTQANVPAIIDTFGGTLQMEASVYPAASNQSVNWSIVPGTGAASISSTGLITAQSDGNVWAKAVSVQNAMMMDSLEITISNQIINVTSVNVSVQGGAPALISTDGGTLQMEATVLPAGANQGVTWSIVPGTGAASISSTGLITAQSDGNVWAKAVSVQDVTMMDSLEITITNQIINVTSVSVSVQAGAPALIATKGGTLQMEATVLPAGANQVVTWSTVPGTGSASISPTGLITALSNGNVWAKAVSVQNTTISDSLEITITNQDTGRETYPDSQKFSIYPNPVSTGVVYARILEEALLSNPVVFLLDICGRVIQSESISSEQFQIKTDGIAAGIYFIKLQTNDYKIVRKLIIE